MRLAIGFPVLALLLTGAAAPPDRPVNTRPARDFTVTMTCQSDASSCEAVVAGGTGPYTWVWYGADEVGGDTDSSVAEPHCWGNPGILVRVQVTDANSAFATTARSVTCP
ncbi:MAG TPA: hypothetical protein VJT67_16705 [Longimicrobiaceae bacterium]|nr:hypothetical protein [Longimicrobiaceae bacterium]